MKLTKILALILALVMMVSLVACGGQPSASDTPDAPDANAPQAAPEAGAEELYTLDILVDVAAPYVESSLDTVVGQKIAEDHGIAFNYVGYTGDMNEYQAMMLAGGTFNEIAYMRSTPMIKQYIEADALVNLDDYKDILPDFYKRFEKSIPYWRATSDDGGLYFWDSGCPIAAPALLQSYDILIRSDVLEYYGWPELRTASDYVDFLTKAVKDFPTTADGQSTVGLTVCMAEAFGAQGVVPVGYEKGETYAYLGNDYYTLNIKTGKIEDYAKNPEVKETLQFWNDLYKNGAMDEECFTDLSDSTLAKMSDGRAIAVWYLPFFTEQVNKAFEAAGTPELSYVQLPFQLDSQDGQGRNIVASYTHNYSGYGISTNCKDVERILKFINWCCTDEGQVMLQSGIEGVHYTVEDGVRVPTDLRIECCQNEDVALREGLHTKDAFIFRGLPTDLGVDANGKPYNVMNEQQYLDQFALTPRVAEAYKAMGWTSSTQWWAENYNVVDVGYAGAGCAPDTNSDLGKTGAKMVETRVKYTAQLIMADDFEAVYADFMEEYDKLDHEAVIQYMNDELAKLSG